MFILNRFPLYHQVTHYCILSSIIGDTFTFDRNKGDSLKSLAVTTYSESRMKRKSGDSCHPTTLCCLILASRHHLVQHLPKNLPKNLAKISFKERRKHPPLVHEEAS